MLIEENSTEYLTITVYDADLSEVTAEIALVLEGVKPSEADWHIASWTGPNAAILVGPGPGGIAYPVGDYMAWIRLTHADEKAILRSGRVRIGTYLG